MIYINTNELNRSQEELRLISKKILSYSDNIVQIGNSLPFDFKYKADLVNTIKKLAMSIDSQADSASQMATCLQTIAATYEAVENRVAQCPSQWTSISRSKTTPSPDLNTATFDTNPENGYYGTCITILQNYTGYVWENGERIPYHQEIIDFVRSYDRYKDYTTDEIMHLLSEISRNGDSCATHVNDIFVAFEGREEEFEKTFGFPMYDEEGLANYHLLLIDYYACTNDYFFNDAPGCDEALLYQFTDAHDEETFISLFGVAPFIDGEPNPAALEAVMTKLHYANPLEIKNSAEYPAIEAHRLNAYLQQKGIEGSASYHNNLSINEVSDYLANGDHVAITAEFFTLYNERGDKLVSIDESVSMTITGITDDGKYIVSYNGHRFFLKMDTVIHSEPSFIVTSFE